jgi:hypothetical protein
VIDAGLLESGPSYVIEIAATTGRTTFAAGDVTLQSFPSAVGVLRSPPFKVSR